MDYNLIKNYFEILGNKKENEEIFYVLENKKSKRSLIFQNNKKAIRFMKNKYSSSIKRIGYFLIRLGVLQIFLKKIKLDSSIGQLIFFGGQTKIFDFNKKVVISFMREAGWEKSFIKNKKEQEIFSKKGFAPKILELNEKVPYCKEELLKECPHIKLEDIFKKLIKYYETQRKNKISYQDYIKKLEKEKGFEKLPLSLREKLKKIKEKKGFFCTLKIHGDFKRDQILLRKNEILFTDWQTREDIILFDLLNFFREEKNILKNEKFFSMLNLFPEEFTEKFKDYLTVFQVKLFFIERGL